MPEPIVDLNFYIASDATTVTVSDNTQNWGDGGIDKSNITATEIIISDNDDTVLITLTDTVTDAAIEIDIEDDIPSLGTELPDGIYKFSATYTHATGTLEATGYFFSTRLLEQNINDDLLDLLTGVQAYNAKIDYEGLERLRRRDNVIFAIEAAEYLSQLENVETLIEFAKKLE